jgi:hypothetical protein
LLVGNTSSTQIGHIFGPVHLAQGLYVK